MGPEGAGQDAEARGLRRLVSALADDTGRFKMLVKVIDIFNHTITNFS